MSKRNFVLTGIGAVAIVAVGGLAATLVGGMTEPAIGYEHAILLMGLLGIVLGAQARTERKCERSGVSPAVRSPVA